MTIAAPSRWTTTEAAELLAKVLSAQCIGPVRRVARALRETGRFCAPLEVELGEDEFGCVLALKVEVWRKPPRPGGNLP